MEGSGAASRLGAGSLEAWEPYAPRHPRHLAIEQTAWFMLEKAERFTAMLGIFIYSSALFALVFSAFGITAPAGSANFALRTVNSVVYLLILPSAIYHWRAMLATAFRHRWLLVFALFVLLSVQWSVNPDWTLRRSTAFLATTAFGIFLSARFDGRTLLKFIAGGLGTAAILSYVFAIFVPQLGREVEIHVGAWRGVFPQKNNLGQVMVLSTVAFLLLQPQRRSLQWIRWAGAALSAGLVVLSTSKTALTVLLAMLVLLPIFRTLRWHYTVAIPALITAVLAGGSVALFIFSRSEKVLALLGKDPTLTGRTEMWELLIQMAGERPLLGYGYSAFWVREWGSPATRVHEILQWETPNAHNGFIDITLEIGLIGLGLFLVSFVFAFARAIRAVRTGRERYLIWPIAYLSFMLLYNVTESAIAGQHNVFWVLYVATVSSAILYPGRGSVGAPTSADEPVDQALAAGDEEPPPDRIRGYLPPIPQGTAAGTSG